MNHSSHWALYGIAAVAFATLPARTQDPASGSTTFEVVSIKPTPSPAIRTGMFPIPGTLTVGNFTLKRLILSCYRIKNYQLEGGPVWMDSEHYDIVGKASFKANMGQMVRMLIPMMEDRFKLKVHRETKELPVFALVVAKGGPKMKPSTPEEAKGRSFSIHGPEIVSFGLDMRFFADVLSGEVDRPVKDETGLTGQFQFTLRYAADDMKPRDPNEPALASEPGAASIYAALQEQLGLKLESRKGPVEVIVVDHAEKPTGN